MSDINERAFDEMVMRQGSEPGFDIGEKAELQVIEDLLRKYACYAILSHTWLQNEPEVTFSDWSSIRNYSASGAGYKKLAGFCEVVAKESGVSLAWMNTICIDKDSSSELDESIRSMYNWYRHASICITYLYNTSSLADMAHDRWFTRGWTLQELLAPRRTQFYDKNWKHLGSSDDDKSANSGTLPNN
ncbi:hypothetical protein BDZ97DRAFT_1921861 [Flammula alnicola]|nr:hypothetical protein BDZ97DRAFT_1921861 [Flammula alnicola]